ncbi:MAG: hypothetical protein WDM79_06605 [Terricaulis sp.]
MRRSGPCHALHQVYVERVLPHAPDIPFDPEGPACAWRDPPKPAPAATP